MSSTSKTGSVRAPVGRRDSGFRIFLPRIFENEDYILPSRNASLSKGRKADVSNGHIKPGSQRARSLWRNLSSMGISRRMNDNIFMSRSVSDLKRLEELCHGLIDSILLFDTKLFIGESSYKLLKTLIRSVLKAGVFSIGNVVSQWKSMTNHIMLTSAGCESKCPEDNIFRILLAFDKVNRLMRCAGSKRDLESLSHLVSSRQLPAADQKHARKSFERFCKVTSSVPVVPETLLSALEESASRIGSFVRDRGYKHGDSHISLSSAATIFNSVKDGGRGKDIVDAITPFLSGIPQNGESYVLPFGEYKCPPGIERYRTLGRPETYSFWTDDIDAIIERSSFEYEGVVYENEEVIRPYSRCIRFGEVLPPETLNTVCGIPVYRQGFDEAIGLQILIVATLHLIDWCRKANREILSRAIFVPEPGFKSRMVTTTEWWVTIVQQGPAHIMRGMLEHHPSAASGLVRSDQAWQCLYLARKAKDFPRGSKVLTSDLRESTDHIPWNVANRLVHGFCRGLGYLSPLLDMTMELVTSPRFIGSQFGGTTTVRGIMMGEPLTKSILTLYCLAVEDLAIRDYLGKPTGPVSVPWRFYAVGGDDHLAAGPPEYLLGIGRYHSMLGSETSIEKTIISDYVVKYCEKLLMVMPLINFFGKDPRVINSGPNEYDNSPMVDSVKVRLLSPTSKSTDIVNERNVAIGKGKSLGKSLKWLQPHAFSTKWINMVRDRFFERMGPLMPERSSGVYWHCLLPEKLGGLDLWLDHDIVDLVHRLPPLSLMAVGELLRPPDQRSEEFLEAIRSFTSNASFRAYTLKQDEKSAIEKATRETLASGFVVKRSFREACLEKTLDPMDSAILNSIKLRRAGYLTKDEVLNVVLRPLLFKQILSGEAKVASYNTIPLKKRYASLWDAYYRGESSVTEDELRRVLMNHEDILLYDLSHRIPMQYRGRRVDTPIFKRVVYGLPELTISYKLIGELL